MLEVRNVTFNYSAQGEQDAPPALTSVCLFYITSLADLTSGLQALLSPLQRVGIPVNAFIMVLVIAFKFVPIFSPF